MTKSPPTSPPLETQDTRNIRQAQENVDAAKEVMVENIGKLLERGELLERLEDKTARMDEQSKMTSEKAKQIYIKSRFDNIAMSAALVGLVFGGLYGLGSGIGLPMIVICGGLGSALCYSAVWMFSGVIQSFLQLPIFNSNVSVKQSNQSIDHSIDHDNRLNMTHNLTEDFGLTHRTEDLFINFHSYTGAGPAVEKGPLRDSLDDISSFVPKPRMSV